MPPADSTTLSRRDALIRLLRLGGAAAGTAGLGLWLGERSARPVAELALNARRSHTVANDPQLPDMAIIQGDDPTQLARQALIELGGIRRFISRSDIVVVKPNIGWDRTPEQAEPPTRWWSRKSSGSAGTPGPSGSLSPTSAATIPAAVFNARESPRQHNVKTPRSSSPTLRDTRK